MTGYRIENERVLEIYTSQQQFDEYRDGGRKKETNTTKVWGRRERAYIKAWWTRNSHRSCKRPSFSSRWTATTTRAHGTVLGGGQDDVAGHPGHRRPSRNRTSKSSVHGSTAGHDWVRPEQARVVAARLGGSSKASSRRSSGWDGCAWVVGGLGRYVGTLVLGYVGTWARWLGKVGNVDTML